jgi:hypothetical protein
MAIRELMAGLLLMVMTAACTGGTAAVEERQMMGDDIVELARGNHSGEPAERMMVIRDATELARIWSATGERGDPPAVDFEQFMVVAAFMGERRTGGYRVRVDSVSQSGDRMTVSVKMEAPGPGCMTTQALTQPYQIVKLPRLEGEVAFDIQQVEVDC